MTGTTLAQRRADHFSARHREFLLTAITRMRRDGLVAVNLTNLAAESPYSKGTWYNHFRSAESLYVEVAIVNAEIQSDLLHDIEGDGSLDDAERLASVFISSVAHASTHPEIWMLGLNARIWDNRDDAGVADAVQRLNVAERANSELVLRFALATEDAPRDADDTAAGLDLARAAADGLGVLTTAKSDHRWSREVSTRLTGRFILDALTSGGFRHPGHDDMDRLCTLAWERVARVSENWLIPRPGSHTERAISVTRSPKKLGKAART